MCSSSHCTNSHAGLLLLLLALFALAASAPPPQKPTLFRTHTPQRLRRGLSDLMSVSKICSNNTPCGWEVYVPFTRRFDYFLDNTCKCAAGTECVLTDDDLSVSAYVYRCRPLASPSEDFTSQQEA